LCQPLRFTDQGVQLAERGPLSMLFHRDLDPSARSFASRPATIPAAALSSTTSGLPLFTSRLRIQA